MKGRQTATSRGDMGIKSLQTATCGPTRPSFRVTAAKF